MIIMARKLVILFSLALTGFVSAKKATFVPRSIATSNALAIRGGAGPLDPNDTAKLAILLAGTHASLSIMSPSRTLKVYSAPSSPFLELMQENIGQIVLSYCLSAYYLIVKGTDLRTAVIPSAAVWFLANVKLWWNEENKKLGVPDGPDWINRILSAFSLYTYVTKADYVDLVIKLVAVYSVAVGLHLAVFPKSAGAMWGVPESAENTAALKYLGHVITGSGLFQALVVFKDMDPTQAFGLSWIPALLMQLSNNFITKENESLGVSKFPSLIWTLVDAIVVVTCGFQNIKAVP